MIDIPQGISLWLHLASEIILIGVALGCRVSLSAAATVAIVGAAAA